jgi:hypothetical protein
MSEPMRKVPLSERWTHRRRPKVLASPVAPTPPTIDYALIFRARIKALGDDGLKEDFQWRVLEAVVALFRDNNPAVTIDEAAAAVRAAIARETAL